MDKQLLQEIGLTNGETKIYSTLIELGSTPAGPIIKKSGMQRSAVYFCLESLIKKGLVGYIIKNNRKYFEANKPQSLFDFLDEKKNEINNQEKELKTLIPLLFARKPIMEDEQEAKIYQGWNGVLNAFFDAINNMKKNEYLCAFTPTAEYGGANPEQVRRLIMKVRLERARKKIRGKILICTDLRNTLGKDQESTKHTEVRYTPKDKSNPAVINVYGNTTLIVLWSKTPVVFSIKSKPISDSFRNYFEIMWSVAKN